MNSLNFLLENTPSNGGNLISTIAMIGVVILVFWLFMIRPQKKQEQKDNAMRDALAVGDEVTTIGGIIGKVISIKGETFVLETTKDKTKIRFLKGAIRSVDVKAEDIAAAIIAEKNATKEAEAASNEAKDNAEAKTEAVAEASTESEENK